ncbi:MAG: PEGA domain-containing protein [Acidobacteria bacterium]|nr:PEGA domain-containing protein [Acidobacteriota bacterium]
MGAYVQPYFYPSFSQYGYHGFGGFYSPFLNLPTPPPAVPYLPKYWWVEPYPSADPRQAGYNPSSGYSRESVTTLLLVTYPLNTRIVLDGIYVGRADYLGPIQLPLGEHTLRVEAPGFEPSETVLNVEEPVLQQLEVRLKPAAQAESKPRP